MVHRLRIPWRWIFLIVVSIIAALIACITQFPCDLDSQSSLSVTCFQLKLGPLCAIHFCWHDPFHICVWRVLVKWFAISGFLSKTARAYMLFYIPGSWYSFVLGEILQNEMHSPSKQHTNACTDLVKSLNMHLLWEENISCSSPHKSMYIILTPKSSL